LFEITRELGSSLRLDETISMLERRMRKLVRFDSLAVFRLDANTLSAAYANGEESALIGQLQIPRGEGLSGWVSRSGKPIVNGKPSVEFGYLNDPGHLSNLNSALAVPLKGTQGPIGVITIYRREINAFTNEDLRLMMAISGKLAIALENVMEFDKVKFSASSDCLTGLPNTKSLFVHLEQELERTRRNNTDLAVVVCDLDGFKQVNDIYGHLEGNRILKEVSAAFQENCRKYDYVARVGGDEFVFIFSGVTPDAAQSKLQQLSTAVRDIGREVCRQEILSASFGTAIYPTDGVEGEELLAEADRRMYQAKRWRKVTAHNIGQIEGLQPLSRAVH
jgi:diguanylate cyclase (GGDEF)-like protein